MTKGLLFDLDGVIVDTAKYHYLAWKQLAAELGIQFDEKDNERLKGVSRMANFEIILSLDSRTMPQEEKEACCKKKNDIYVAYINKLQQEEILPGVREFIEDTRKKGYKIALGSVSKNAPLILERLAITDLFDKIIDGTKVEKAKPDPEVFLKGAQELEIQPEDCIVFEDSVAGIEAAHNGGMKAVGIGKKVMLSESDLVIPGFANIDIDTLRNSIEGR